MRSYIVDISPVMIEINSHIFTLQKSDGEAYALVLDYLDAIHKSDKSGSDCIMEMIKGGCELADSLLGNGACYTIFGDTPISLGHVASLCAQIGRGCLQAYRQYMKEEYAEGCE